MAKGTIKRLVADKGFGFIREDGGSREFFFHRTAVDGDFADLREGQSVSYEEEHSEKGPRAAEVRAN